MNPRFAAGLTAVVLIAAVALFSWSSADNAEGKAYVDALERIDEQACTCTDLTCIDAIQSAIDQVAVQHAGAQGSSSQIARATELARHTQDCLAKAAGAEPSGAGHP